MIRLIFMNAAVLTAAAFLFSCQKPTFIPETEYIPEDTKDEIGVYEEGIYVTVGGAGQLTGHDWNDAMSADIFREKLQTNAFADGTVIHLAEGCYTLGIDKDNIPVITKDLIIKGGYRSGIYTQYPNRYYTYLTGGTDFRIMTISAESSISLDGVGFTGSTGTSDKSPVCIDGGTLKITNATICNNYSAFMGGAIQVTSGGKFEAESCVIRNNVAKSGGAIRINSTESSCVLTNCKINGNQAHERGGALYVVAGNANVTNCEFNGNECVKNEGGSFYITSAATLNSTNNVFEGEHSGKRGAIIGIEGDGTKAFFNGCSFENCSAVASSPLFNHVSGQNILYFNGCSIFGSHIEEKYGLIAAVNSTGLSLGFNNCTMAGAYSNWPNANSQQCCWFNITSIGKMTMSNCSLIGVPSSATKELPTFGLVRLNGDNVNASFFNNIIVSTSEGGYSLYGGDTQKDLSITGAYNKTSPITTQTIGTFNYVLGTGDDTNLYASNFDGLTLSGKAWVWNNTNMTARTADVNAEIQKFDPAFYEWLSSIDALGKDIYGTQRGESSWPGSYQK